MSDAAPHDLDDEMTPTEEITDIATAGADDLAAEAVAAPTDEVVVELDEVADEPEVAAAGPEVAADDAGPRDGRRPRRRR